MGESVYILEMLKLQQRLNDNTNGKRLGERHYKKMVRLSIGDRCIYLEVAEVN